MFAEVLELVKNTNEDYCYLLEYIRQKSASKALLLLLLLPSKSSC